MREGRRENWRIESRERERENGYTVVNIYLTLVSGAALHPCSSVFPGEGLVYRLLVTTGLHLFPCVAWLTLDTMEDARFSSF